MKFKVYSVAMVEKTNLILMKLVELQQCRAAIHDVVLVLGCAALVILRSTVVVMVHAKKEADLARTKMLADQAEARRTKVKEAKRRREDRQAAKKNEMLEMYAKEDEAAAAKK